MPAQIVTTDDLTKLKEDLIREMRALLRVGPIKKESKWLKSSEVKEILNISPNTLTAFRKNGSLPFTKVGGTFYYDKDEIENLLQSK